MRTLQTTNGLGFVFILLCIYTIDIFAGAEISAKMNAGAVASSVTNSFGSVAKLITAGSYLGGLAFSISAIMKFKQHKDNPTQVPIGTPIGLAGIAFCLLFLPSLLDVAGKTIFSTGAKTAGPHGVSWNPTIKEVTQGGN